MFTNLPSIGPQCDLLTWCIFVLLCFANTLTCVFFFVFGGPLSLTTLLEESSPAQARQVHGEQSSLQVNSYVQQDHKSSTIDAGLWLGTKNTNHWSTSIQMGISCRTSSLRLASQGSLTRSWKRLPLFSLTQLTAPRTPRMYYSYNRLTFGKKQRDGTWFHCYSSELFIFTAIHIPQLKKKKTKFKTQLSSKTMTLKIYCHIWAI